MFILAWLMLGSGGYLAWCASANRNPVATATAWLRGEPLPKTEWQPVPKPGTSTWDAIFNPKRIDGAGGSIGGALAGAAAEAAKRYKLGAVSSNVASAAAHFASKFGIATVYGKGPGSVPGSDHPKGLALDFMTSSKSKGDALAADVVASASAWNVKYVIWYGREWSPSKGWHIYTGFNPHTDHVHVSFNA